VIPRFRRGTTALWRPPQADEHAGVFTVAQAIAAGLGRGQAAHRVKSHAWQRVAGQGFVLEGTAIEFRHEVWAAVLTWPAAVLWGQTAVRLWQERTPFATPHPVHVIVPSHRRAQHRLIPHVNALDAAAIRTVSGFRVTDPMTSLADALRVLPPREAASVFAWHAALRLIDEEEFAVAITGLAGRRGVRAVRPLAAMARSGAASELEFRVHELLASAGLTGWEPNVEVLGADGRAHLVDALFRRERLIVELDGYAFHGDRDAFERDRAKNNALLAAGYRVLRFTWSAVTEHEDRTAATIRQALGLRPL
jgi:hypothetical protein